jgi:hypothetical protein
MTRQLRFAALALTALVAGCGSTTPTHSLTATPAATEGEATPAETPPPRVREAPKPKGRYVLSATYELGDFGESGDPARGYRFIGGGTLTNTGNIGIVVRVTYKWRLLGEGSLVAHRQYRLARHAHRDIDITIPATDAQIDAHQNADGKSSARATMIDTFGTTPYE